LHDIGYSRGNNDEHHKNSLKMILETALAGFNPTETVIIATPPVITVKAFPSPNHRHYATLTPEAATIVRRLAAFLRIADGLDRSHRSLVL
jgi:exopolyphosphatase/guanosine-5'-triphosphate,3'-diphosphate pyrophosphatase